jgi:hypothetical protein
MQREAFLLLSMAEAPQHQDPSTSEFSTCPVAVMYIVLFAEVSKAYEEPSRTSLHEPAR